MPTTRRLAAIMFTDIVGYSALMQQNEQQAIAHAKRHQEVLESCTSHHEGEVLNYYGDGSLIVFPSASEAVRCAIDIQRAFQKNPVLPLRIGIHTGEIHLEDGKVFGDGVNIASRLESLGVAGSVTISEKVVNEVRNQEDITTRFLGVFELKNIDNPINVYAIEATGLVIPNVKEMQGKAKILDTKLRGSAREPLASKLLVRTLAILGGLAIITAFLGIYFDFWKGPANASEPFKLTPFTTSSWFEGFPSWSPDGNMYAYTSLEPGNADIFIRNRNEGDAIHIVETPYDEYNPRWSPDGSKIAYISVRPEGTNIYWVPATGGLERKAAETYIPGIEQSEWPFYGFGISPWSPDSKELIFSRMIEDGSLAIFKVNLQTGVETQLTNPPSGSIDLLGSLSPDGQSIVFQRNGRLWIKNLQGNQGEESVLPNIMAITPAFSKDNQKILFTAIDPETGMNIWDYELTTKTLRQITFTTKLMMDPSPMPGKGLSVDQFSHKIDLMIKNLSSGEEKQITYHNGDNYYGRFSPDGSKLLYQSNRTGNSEIWLKHLDGEGQEINLTDNQAFDFRADWSPDGKQIAFFSDRDSTFKVWIMDAEGKNLRKVNEQEIEFAYVHLEYVHQLKWSPRGNKIAYMAISEYGNSVWVLDPESGDTRPVAANANSFAWYQDDKMLICNRRSADPEKSTDLVAINLETGAEKTLREGLPLTELFASADGRWLGYTYALGHFSYNLNRLQLQPPIQPGGFPTVRGEPEQITFGDGKWHVHNGTFSPDAKSVLYSRDADEMDIFIIKNYK